MLPRHHHGVNEPGTPMSQAQVPAGQPWMPRALRWAALLGLSVALATVVSSPHGPSLTLGQAAPAMRVATPDGQQVDLAAYRGRPLLLNFFATWCLPCKVEIPLLNQAHEQGGAKLPVVGVLVFSGLPPGVQQALQPMGIRYPVWVTDDETAQAWRVEAVPMTYLLDGRGVIRWMHAGPVGDSDLAEAEALVANQAAGPATAPTPAALHTSL